MKSLAELQQGKRSHDDAAAGFALGLLGLGLFGLGVALCSRVAASAVVAFYPCSDNRTITPISAHIALHQVWIALENISPASLQGLTKYI